jgi:hypothetical protein
MTAKEDGGMNDGGAKSPSLGYGSIVDMIFSPIPE